MISIKNFDFNASIQNELKTLKYRRKVDEIFEIFDKDKIYVIGGFVRDSICNVLYGSKIVPHDLDLLIMDSSFDEKVKVFQNPRFSKFGGLKFQYLGFSVDLFGIENLSFFKKNPTLEKNLENALKGCDISTSAIAYGLEKKEFYGDKAMKDIYQKQIDLLHEDFEIIPTITRLIVHSQRTKFNLTEKSLNYIKKNYSEKMVGELYQFLRDKGIPFLLPEIKKDLDLILK